MEIGDKVNYSGRIIEEEPTNAATIKNIMRQGSIFKMDMAIISGVDHWVPMCDLTPYKE